MRTRLGLGLLSLLTLVLQVSLAEDLYWEGEDDVANEFLEVKEDRSFAGHLQRIKRGLWDPFGIFEPSTTTATPAPENEINTEDPDDGDADDEGEGSGINSGTRFVEIENPNEKTLRVTFVVMQPYQVEYSNRDSPEFQRFSTTMAQAVNVLFDNLPGTQKANLIRIQSRLADNFSCKVTMEIVTTGYDNTDKIKTTLRDHIINYRQLANVAVKDDDFSAIVVNPGSPFETCEADQIQCDDGFCISGASRCDGNQDCSDGSDEQGCPANGEPVVDQQANEVDSSPSPEYHQEDCEIIPCASSSVTICKSQRCNGVDDCPSGDDEANCLPPSTPPAQVTERGDETYTTPTVLPGNENPPPTTTSYPVREQTCLPGEFRCDDKSRCIAKSSVCDRRNDCYDGTDELDCPG